MPGSPIVRVLHRLPLWLRSAGIRGYERVLGVDWLVLTTRGRRSGRPRTVMLDVVGHDDATDTWYVQPVDARSHWFRNVRNDPRVTVEVHRRTFEAHATDVTGPEGAEVVLRFLRTHPLYGRLIVWLVGYVDTVDRGDDDLRARLTNVPVIALRPLGETLASTP